MCKNPFQFHGLGISCCNYHVINSCLGLVKPEHWEQNSQIVLANTSFIILTDVSLEKWQLRQWKGWFENQVDEFKSLFTNLLYDIGKLTDFPQMTQLIKCASPGRFVDCNYLKKKSASAGDFLHVIKKNKQKIQPIFFQEFAWQ